MFTDSKVNPGVVLNLSFLHAAKVIMVKTTIDNFAFILKCFMPNLNKTNYPFSVLKEFVNNNFNAFSFNDSSAFLMAEFQYQQNSIYRDWCSALNKIPSAINDIRDLAYLPISFFKTHKVVSGRFDPDVVFTSSGTTQTINSKHYVKDMKLYKQSFIKAFEMFYGSLSDWCIIGLLPSYLERSGSSLIIMVEDMMQLSGHQKSGFYLYELDKLHEVLVELERQEQKVLLIGVTFALVDFAEKYEMQLNHTIVMETGGMKGRRKELTRQEVHDLLKKRLGVRFVHSEYGMTELLSQAYSKDEGRFYCPPWMKVLVRDEEDPLIVGKSGRGVLNIIDLANIYSCAFIATDDVGVVYEDGSFEVWGRRDNSDIRGCSLLVV